MDKGTGAFRFKQFSVSHDQCAMKVGTDAVLLGAWTRTDGALCILDIGTGCGVLALMMAQRTSPAVRIEAVEIAEQEFRQATENVRLSPWPEKIKVHHTSIQSYETDTRYDLIVCNPPYFTNSLLPPAPARIQARHDRDLTLADVLKSVRRLLSPGGTFSLVLPTEEGNQFQSLAGTCGLFCSRRLAFFARKEKPQERWLMEFTFAREECAIERLVLYEKGNEWTEDYSRLIKEFYWPG